ncbi:hypothetical protein ACE7GA_00970 [Roseomonas sp. CCTCC AB2023176]|uniref:hypothetical protein n=1 Tax=Roseomonas sp. CCTCC AB2023176 TaxID=3342640 RepID=UPI0035E2A6B8
MTGIPGVIDLASITSDTRAIRVDGAAAGDFSGVSVASAGDVNGDGYADLIVGAYGADPSGRSGAGSSYVLFGKAAGFADVDLASLSAVDGFRVDGEATGDFSGRPVASAGDLNGDGYADLIIGAYNAGPSERPFAGSSYVLLGKAAGFADVDLASLSTADGFRVDGATAGDNSGYSVASAGDVNGDGYADLIVGAYSADPLGRSGAGSSYVLFGKAGGFSNVDLSSLSAVDGFRVDGAAAGDNSGNSVASAGDVNGDGCADLVIGAYNAGPSGRAFAGSSYVLFGKAAGFSNVDLASLSAADGFRVDGAMGDLSGSSIASASDFSGYSVASAGDVNGDGYDDLVIGAFNARPFARASAGSSYVLFGKADGFADVDLASLSAADGFRIDGAAAGDFSGVSVASAGDVNGDGYADLVIGAYAADPSGRSFAGSSYVLFGKAGGFSNVDLASLSAADGFRVDGASGGDLSGLSVASAGDLDGDSYADLVIGAYNAAPSGRSAAGSSTVIYGEPTAAVSRTAGGFRSAAFGGDFSDTLTGTVADDLLVGRDGADTLTGGAGVDSLAGGAGDDTYVVEDAGDVVTEAPGGGFDVLYVSVTATLPDNVEALVVIGTAAVNLTGGAGDDVLVGNEAANVLAGGAGNDNYSVNGSFDTIVEEAGGGIDAVYSTADLTLPENVEVLVLLGAAVYGTGNAGDNVVLGNAADNILSGGAGYDVLEGGAGADILIGGNGPDALTGGAGADLFRFEGLADAFAGAVNTGDTLLDFTPGEDRIQLNAAAFGLTGVVPGVTFVSADVPFAATTAPTLLYSGATGGLFHDANGTEDGGLTLLATLVGRPALSAADFAFY